MADDVWEKVERAALCEVCYPPKNGPSGLASWLPLSGTCDKHKYALHYKWGTTRNLKSMPGYSGILTNLGDDDE